MSFVVFWSIFGIEYCNLIFVQHLDCYDVMSLFLSLGLVWSCLIGLELVCQIALEASSPKVHAQSEDFKIYITYTGCFL